jgi:hypothetical protein
MKALELAVAWKNSCCKIAIALIDSHRSSALQIMKVGEINSRIHSECIAATHNATHNKDHLHVLRRTYAAVRDLQVVECIR